MEQYSRLPSGDFPYLRASRTNMGLQIHLCESLLSHIRALGEFPVQWVYTKTGGKQYGNRIYLMWRLLHSRSDLAGGAAAHG